MADVVKRLTQRVVVPSCVGSNPIIRPIKNSNETDCSVSFFLFYILNFYEKHFSKHQIDEKQSHDIIKVQ